MRAFLILEDGTVFRGTAIGFRKDVISEIVFNTSMSGYLEVLTDPSYCGQAVVMTYPLIGNYGVCRADMEAERVWPDALIVRELSRLSSNFRDEIPMRDFLVEQEVPGICGIDTRALTKRLREKGTMRGMLTTSEDVFLEDGEARDEVLQRIRGYECKGAVARTTCKEKKSFPGDGLQVALLDLGAKRNICRSLRERGCHVDVYPAFTKAEEILADRPDGIMLSNGPGDPKECGKIIAELRKLYDSDVPIFAICLGHQLMALAMGADTYKMKYGHRGGNHPVRDLETGRVYISSQNHGYVVDASAMPPEVGKPWFVNVNDGTCEGISYAGKRIYTVQFHPEACPGPRDSGILFDKFIGMMRERIEKGA